MLITHDLQEKMVYTLIFCARKDANTCFAKVEFQVEDDLISTSCLISCKEGTEKSAQGARLQICYSHHNPSKNVLVMHPVARIPKGDRFHSLGRCAPVTYGEAMKCRRIFFGVLYTLIAVLLFSIALCFSAIICRKCKACFDRRRIVIPDPSMEMTPDHF